MEHDWIDEHQVAERYLLGQLAAAEAAEFEEHSLGCPECLDRLEAAEGLAAGLKRAAAREAALWGVALQVGLFARLARLSRSRQASVLVMALLLAVVLPGGLLLRRVGELGRELDRARQYHPARPTSPALPSRPPAADPEAPLRAARAEAAAHAAERRAKSLAAELAEARQPLVNPLLLTLGAERSAPGGAEPSTRIDLASAPPWIVLVLELDAPDRRPYGLALRGPDGRVRWRGTGFVPDGKGDLSVAFPQSLLAPGDSTVEVLGPAPIARFTFRVVASGKN